MFETIKDRIKGNNSTAGKVFASHPGIFSGALIFLFFTMIILFVDSYSFGTNYEDSTDVDQGRTLATVNGLTATVYLLAVLLLIVALLFGKKVPLLGRLGDGLKNNPIIATIVIILLSFTVITLFINTGYFNMNYGSGKNSEQAGKNLAALNGVLGAIQIILVIMAVVAYYTGQKARDRDLKLLYSHHSDRWDTRENILQNGYPGSSEESESTIRRLNRDISHNEGLFKDLLGVETIERIKSSKEKMKSMFSRPLPKTPSSGIPNKIPSAPQNSPNPSQIEYIE